MTTASSPAKVHAVIRMLLNDGNATEGKIQNTRQIIIIKNKNYYVYANKPISKTLNKVFHSIYNMVGNSLEEKQQIATKFVETYKKLKVQKFLHYKYKKPEIVLRASAFNGYVTKYEITNKILHLYNGVNLIKNLQGVLLGELKHNKSIKVLISSPSSSSNV